MTTEETWYVRHEGRITGPLSLSELQKLADPGTLTSRTEVSRDGDLWMSAAGVDGLVLPGLTGNSPAKKPLPGSRSTDSQELSWDEIRTLARWQYFGNLAMLLVLLVYWGLILSSGLPLALAALLWIGLSCLGTAIQFGFVTGIVRILRYEHSWLWSIAAPIPLLGAFVLYLASRAATRRLQAQGLRVGMLGARPPASAPEEWQYEGPRVTVPRTTLHLGAHALLSAGVGLAVSLVLVLLLVLAALSHEPDPAGAGDPAPAVVC